MSARSIKLGHKNPSTSRTLPMAITFTPKTALIVIDVQNGFKLAPYSHMQFFPDLHTVVGNIASVIEAFRAASLPVIHVHHDSLESDSTLHATLCPAGFAVLPEAAPVGGEAVFVKNVNSGFIGTGLEAHLRSAQIDTLVILGLTTSHCVSTTTRMAGNLGWPKQFDAETMHEVALAELHEEFATIVTTEEILAGLKK
ncbi:Isochorismatase-like protein [Mycena epipterygia]|nr:Isochorismatase-like protein [Mycena epipterygia]